MCGSGFVFLRPTLEWISGFLRVLPKRGTTQLGLVEGGPFGGFLGGKQRNTEDHFGGLPQKGDRPQCNFANLCYLFRHSTEKTPKQESFKVFSLLLPNTKMSFSVGSKGCSMLGTFDQETWPKSGQLQGYPLFPLHRSWDLSFAVTC